MKWRPCWCTKAILAACSLHSQRDRYGEQSFGRGAVKPSSSETQGEIVVARESLNRWKNMVQRKVKNSEKSPWGQCLTRPVPNGHRHSAFWLCRKTQTLSPFFTFLCAIFFRPFSFPHPHYLPLGLQWCKAMWEIKKDGKLSHAQIQFHLLGKLSCRGELFSKL